jgi:hypothetical protein
MFVSTDSTQNPVSYFGKERMFVCIYSGNLLNLKSLLNIWFHSNEKRVLTNNLMQKT